PDDRSPGNGWMIEGQAMWVGAELGPGESSVVPSHWRPYLDEPRTPLFQRTYDAIGFYARLADAGIDPWTVLDPMLRRSRATSDPRAIFAEAVPAGSQDRFFRSWATGYAREPGLG